MLEDGRDPSVKGYDALANQRGKNDEDQTRRIHHRSQSPPLDEEKSTRTEQGGRRDHVSRHDPPNGGGQVRWKCTDEGGDGRCPCQGEYDRMCTQEADRREHSG